MLFCTQPLGHVQEERVFRPMIEQQGTLYFIFTANGELAPRAS